MSTRSMGDLPGPELARQLLRGDSRTRVAAEAPHQSTTDEGRAYDS